MNVNVGAACYLVAPAVELGFMILAFSYGGSYFAAVAKAAVVGAIAVVLLPQLIGISVILFLAVSAWNAVRRILRCITEKAADAGYALYTVQALCDWRRNRRLRRLYKGRPIRRHRRSWR